VSSRFAERAARIALIALAALGAAGALRAAEPGRILGTWKGTSTCVGNPDFPACHDEAVVYEVREAAAGGGAVTLAAFKIVGGEKAPMGELDFAYDEKQGAWVSELRTPRAHALWALVVRGDEITGTLVDLPSKHLVRNVAVRRETGGR
jgi:hypothetical protein